MIRRTVFFLFLVPVLVACTTTENAPQQPTVVPFPTTTPGVAVRGVVPLFDVDAGINPATAVAIANQPTPTPDTRTCPPLDSETDLTDDLSESNSTIIDELLRFLNAGGTASTLRETMRDEWGILGESGTVREDADLTGEGQPDLIISYSAPDEGGVLLVAGCVDRRYEIRYRADSDQITAPEIVLLGDMNRDGRGDLLFTTRRCDVALSDTCGVQTQLVTFQPDVGRFTSLLGAIITAENAAQPIDIDNDEVNELVLRVENDGNEATGPLRTGTNIYDWNGTVYVLSIVQPDPPRYRIQIVHEADRQLIAQDVGTAIALYEQALNNDDLRNWFGDEEDTLTSYILYRLLTARALDAAPELAGSYQRIVEAFPSPEQTTPFIEMAQLFWDAYNNTSGDSGAACVTVREYIAVNLAPLEFLNRYGSRSPTYTALDLCPMETVVIEEEG